MEPSRDIDIPRALRELRLGAGLTQEQLACVLGRPQSYVSKLEAGTRRLGFAEAFDYADALGTTVDEMAAVARRAHGALVDGSAKGE